MNSKKIILLIIFLLFFLLSNNYTNAMAPTTCDIYPLEFVSIGAKLFSIVVILFLFVYLFIILLSKNKKQKLQKKKIILLILGFLLLVSVATYIMSGYITNRYYDAHSWGCRLRIDKFIEKITNF